ncbi:xanthine dehydrogenase family protein molybdopterin-binding subunit [Acidimangrovimonas sediminis]|uniref:xanthine dehydrogenase family protein molybdopterin-binding subunit n=1 Tax=Acidimangrovimonas sediminis TaxID=2056283 RepID=UPI000C7FA62C|nr:xanthine dehydrogenase family protein molybdopterin-binding subunit [Acidimangrovimonas sediminis]
MPDVTPLPAATPIRMGSNAGQPRTRADGLLKVTGRATYAADNHPAGMAQAVLVTAAIARGRVTAMNVEAARAHPGVVEVYTPANRPELALEPDAKPSFFSKLTETLQDDTVRYEGQPIALVVAETLEAATEAARLLAPQYAAETARVGFDLAPYAPESVGFGFPIEMSKGDIAAGLSEAASTTETVVETPPQYHNAMETHAIVAEWKDGKLYLDTPTQAPGMSAAGFAAWLGLDPADVVIRSPFLGGGFGSKAAVVGAFLLAIQAAKLLDRPVKLALARHQMFGHVFHRGATRQTIKLGMDAEGRLTAIDHHTTAVTAAFEEFIEGASGAARTTYAAPAIRASHDGVRNDVGVPGAMRAPGEASGSAALEIAADVAAEAAGLDPLEFRLRNYAETDPMSGLPYSSKALRECYAEGAREFGWAGRPLAPRQMTDDAGMLVGWGVGTATFPCPMFGAEARATLRADGTAVIETALIDMGQGSWTAMAQIAADSLGLDVEQVEIRGGVSDLPDSGVAGGSGYTATLGLAIDNAGGDTIRQLAEIASSDPDSPLHGTGNTRVVARGGRLYAQDDESRSESYADILARAGRETLSGEGKGARGENDANDHSFQSHGAVFAEVKVDPDLGQVRVTRLVGAFAAGRIINPRMVESQLSGGMIWGISFALHEGAEMDPRTGRILNRDFGEYHVSVNSDAPSVKVLTIPEEDAFVNPLGVKGVGEIGVTGTAGAIANAIWHATGKRVTSYPIRLEELLDL